MLLLCCCILARACWLHACMQCWLHVQRRDPGQEARRSEGSLRPAPCGAAWCRPPARRAQLPGSSFFPASKGCLLQRHSFGPALTAAYALFPVPDSYYSALCMLHWLGRPACLSPNTLRI